MLMRAATVVQQLYKLLQWRSQRGGGVQTPSIEKVVHFYCLVIEQKQW